MDPPTPNDNLIYLLIELERAVKHANMVWSRELAISVQRKLVDLIQHLDPIT